MRTRGYDIETLRQHLDTALKAAEEFRKLAELLDGRLMQESARADHERVWVERHARRIDQLEKQVIELQDKLIGQNTEAGPGAERSCR